MWHTSVKLQVTMVNVSVWNERTRKGDIIVYKNSVCINIAQSRICVLTRLHCEKIVSDLYMTEYQLSWTRRYVVDEIYGDRTISTGGQLGRDCLRRASPTASLSHSNATGLPDPDAESCNYSPRCAHQAHADSTGDRFWLNISTKTQQKWR